MKKIISLMLMLVAYFASFAQNTSSGGARATIEGVVYEEKLDGRPIEFAVVKLSPSGDYTTTDAHGKFRFDNVDLGKSTITLQFIGMTTIDTLVSVSVAGKVYRMEFVMHSADFRLDDVVVTASPNKAGSSTSSNISRQAMDHLQTSSLSDLMSLLPGVAFSNSDLSTANVITLRTLGAGGSTEMNSLGTSVIVDGAPVSNNANFQTLAPVISGSVEAVGGGASASSGVDIRSIATDNIESVEIIRGIPSVEYGDLTSGAVIINSKAGRQPLSIRVKINPKTYQASISKGFSLGEKAGNLNLSGDYAYNTTKLTEAYAYYQRLNFKALYSKNFLGNLNTNTSLDFTYGNDTRKMNPDDLRSRYSTGAENIGFRFTTNGIATINWGWFKSIRYNASFSYTDKHSFQEELLENAFAPYFMSTTDGAILSNISGQKVYDTDGNEITNISAADMTNYATYLPNEYFSRYDIYGKELNAYAKVVANFSKRWGNITNRIIVGADYKMDGNNGKGQVYDPATPPYRPASGSNSAYRPMTYSDIPFLHQFGAFIEDSYQHDFGKGFLFNLTAGLRYDNVNSKSVLAPRINASMDVVPEILTLRGGYGITAKAPTAMYLYPDNAYFDFVNFNTLGDESIPVSQQLLVGTTRVFSTENPDLEIATNRKIELGLDLKVHRYRLSVTAYDELMENGYELGRSLDCFKLIKYNVYRADSYPEAGIPSLTLDRTHNIFVSYYTPMNTSYSRDRGIEYELDLGRFDAIRTSVNLSGAWMKGMGKSGNYSYSTAKNGNELERNIGVYEPGVTQYWRERLISTLRITHNIPKIGFVVTLTTQVNWMDKTWTEYGMDDMFIKYISYKDGKVYDFDPAMKDDPEFAYLFPALNDNRFIAESYFPTVLFNLQLTKEISDVVTASFYVNNIFSSRPLYESKKNPGSFTELGIPIYFGFDLKVNIK